MFNFDDAAKRHFGDADLLFQERRLANADQLYGISAECALKAVMVRLGVPTRSEGDLEENRYHINKLWSEFQAFAGGRRGSRCFTPVAEFMKNPFADWDVSQRYSADSVCPSGARVIGHQKAAKACLVALHRSMATS